MAHGVKARYPFLDHKLFEFAAALPTGSGLRGKEVLRRWASRVLGSQFGSTKKTFHPAPDAQSFFVRTSPAWISDNLTTDALGRVGIFSPSAVGGLMQRCRNGLNPTLGEKQAIVGVLSTQLWHHQFMDSAFNTSPLRISEASVVLGDGYPSPGGAANVQSATSARQ